MELEPPFEHVALAEKESRLDPTGILQILDCCDHHGSFAYFKVTSGAGWRGPAQPRRPRP